MSNLKSFSSFIVNEEIEIPKTNESNLIEEKISSLSDTSNIPKKILTQLYNNEMCIESVENFILGKEQIREKYPDLWNKSLIAMKDAR